MPHLAPKRHCILTTTLWVTHQSIQARCCTHGGGGHILHPMCLVGSWVTCFGDCCPHAAPIYHYQKRLGKQCYKQSKLWDVPMPKSPYTGYRYHLRRAIQGPIKIGVFSIFGIRSATPLSLPEQSMSANNSLDTNHTDFKRIQHSLTRTQHDLSPYLIDFPRPEHRGKLPITHRSRGKFILGLPADRTTRLRTV